MIKTGQNGNEQPLRLLIVDGLAHSRNSLAAFFQLQENLDVIGTTAVSANTIHLTQQLKPDVIILDANLPDDDSFLLTRQLRTLDTPPTIILLTIRGRDYEVAKAKEAGAIALVEKSKGIAPLLSILSSISQQIQM